MKFTKVYEIIKKNGRNVRKGEKPMSHISEYEVENILIDRLESIGYSFIKLNTYEDVLANFRAQLAEFNAKKLEEKGHAASFSDTEFNRIMIHMDNHSVYDVRRHIVGGANRTLFSVDLPPRLCRTGT